MIITARSGAAVWNCLISTRHHTKFWQPAPDREATPDTISSGHYPDQNRGTRRLRDCWRV